MTATIVTKYNGTATEEPADADVVQGELAVNTADGRLWVGHSSGLTEIGVGGHTEATGALGTAMITLNDTGTEGHYIHLQASGVTKATLGAYNTGSAWQPFLSSSRVGIGVYEPSPYAQGVIPVTGDGAAYNTDVTLGYASAKWAQLHAVTSTISTSDRSEKQQIAELNDAERRVATAAKGLLRKFKLNKSVSEKGDAARTHFGIIAQDLQDAFDAEGLNANDYGMFCSDTWWEHEGKPYEEAEVAPEGAKEITLLGIRYEELLAFIIAAI